MEISTFIKPTIGRVVWYRPSEDDMSRDIASDGKQPLAAIIAYVHSDEYVNLTVFSADGYPRARMNVMLIQGEKDVPEGCCRWMPYQMGQAAKTAELEAKVLREMTAESETIKVPIGTTETDAEEIKAKVAGVASEPAVAEAKAPADAPKEAVKK